MVYIIKMPITEVKPKKKRIRDKEYMRQKQREFLDRNNNREKLRLKCNALYPIKRKKRMHFMYIRKKMANLLQPIFERHLNIK